MRRGDFTLERRSLRDLQLSIAVSKCRPFVLNNYKFSNIVNLLIKFCRIYLSRRVQVHKIRCEVYNAEDVTINFSNFPETLGVSILSIPILSHYCEINNTNLLEDLKGFSKVNVSSVPILYYRGLFSKSMIS